VNYKVEEVGLVTTEYESLHSASQLCNMTSADYMLTKRMGITKVHPIYTHITE